MAISKTIKILLIILGSIVIITGAIVVPVVIFRGSPTQGIEILSDDDFAKYNLPGTGSSNDPYILENYEISPEDSLNGIHITSVTKYFIIRNCIIEPKVEIGGFRGISIRSISNDIATVMNNTIRNCAKGIYVYNSEGVTIEDNSIYNSKSSGIEVTEESDYAIVMNNYCESDLIRYITDNTPFMDWNTVSGGYYYQIQIDTVPMFTVPIRDYTSTATSYIPTALGDGTYYWRVRARDQAGNWGAWSGIWHFTIDTIGPDQVILFHPVNGNAISDTTPLLEWYASPEAIEYEILVDTTDAFSSPFVFTSTSEVTFNINTILADGAYYWKVRAKDSLENWGEWSETWSFTIDATPPDQPSLSSPANGTLSNDNQPQLIVGIVSTAVTYHFQIATSDSFDTLIINIIVPSNGYDLESVLIDGTYYWRVRAADSLENWSEWSETWAFTIDTTNPEINQPDDITYDYGTIHHNITWLLSELHPSSITIYHNGIERSTMEWTSYDNLMVVCSINGLAVGEHNFTIVVTDLVGNSFSDTVIVTVVITIPELSRITGLMIIGLCAVIPVLAIKQKFKKKK